MIIYGNKLIDWWTFHFFKENQRKEYSLVIEYANSGTLRSYLKENFENLTWNDKFNFAFQLTYAVSCLHSEGIMHRDLVISYLRIIIIYFFLILIYLNSIIVLLFDSTPIIY
jgi:serine/threonine protein kinase